jgi:hypothetical protein
MNDEREGPVEHAVIAPTSGRSAVIRGVKRHMKQMQADKRCAHDACGAEATHLIGVAGSYRSLCSQHAHEARLESRIKLQRDIRNSMKRGR